MKIGIVIGRIGGIDGVALETEKWIAVLEGRMGHEVRVLTGALEGDIHNATVLPELAFDHPFTVHEQEVAFFGTATADGGDSAFIATLEKHAWTIEEQILSWIDREGIELLISENASAIPCHLTMGMAVEAVFRKTGINGVTHDHDFRWERGERYVSPVAGIDEIMARCFPVHLPNVRHAVINLNGQKTLAQRFGIEGCVVVPNVMDFDASYARQDDYNAALLSDLGLAQDTIPLFQITRIVRRKGIEVAIDLVSRLRDDRVALVITGTSVDDSDGYTEELMSQAARLGLTERVLFAGHRFDAYCRTDTEEGHAIYSLQDGYARAKGCTYFSSYEGFGNAFVEAVVARRPVFVNDYEPVYWPDIGSRGFDAVMIRDLSLTDEAVDAVREVLQDPARAEQMVEKNFALGREHFSYQALERLLTELLPSS